AARAGPRAEGRGRRGQPGARRRHRPPLRARRRGVERTRRGRARRRRAPVFALPSTAPAALAQRRPDVKLRIATRKSQLALTQSEWVASRLRERDPSLEVELVTIETKGDRETKKPLAAIGGKGLFVSEVE